MSRLHGRQTACRSRGGSGERQSCARWSGNPGSSGCGGVVVVIVVGGGGATASSSMPPSMAAAAGSEGRSRL
ncbi:hypothetical protein DAI22_06g279200 [Oryza sativa Japonica Group]|nr:hypothetical protein DAI22_06g279200 [Oryza sativa Japonica Group]